MSLSPITIAGRTEVWKYEVQAGEQVLDMPRWAVVVAAGWQTADRLAQQRAFVWAVVMPKARLVHRRLALLNTGGGLPEGEAVYVGVLQARNGIVWHVLDYGEEPT